MGERARGSDSSTNVNHAEELQHREQYFSARQHSYELTQKLSYFVISIELVFCGYILLNAEKLSGMKGANYLFLICGVAALLGILWRFIYNQTYHDRAHKTQGKFHNTLVKVQLTFYWLYVLLSIVAFVWGLVAGFIFLSSFL